MNYYTTEGIILKRRSSFEVDRIVTVFTKKHGKITIKAPGSRKLTSRRSPHIEPLTHSSLSVSVGRYFPILAEAQTINSYSSLKNNLKSIGYGYYVCELIDRLCAENQEQPSVFTLLQETLAKLAMQPDYTQIISKFEAQLLIYLGFFSRKQQGLNINVPLYVEQIIERKLKTPLIIQKFL